MNFCVKIIRKLIFGYRADQESYVKYLKKIGVRIGDSIEIFQPANTYIDIVNPHLLELGSNISITGPSTILTHDYGVCVTKKFTCGEILGKQLKTKIGDNVFIGWGACILPGTTVNNNTIIGAYSVVSGFLEPNSVYAGNPGKKICSIEEYYEKRKQRQLQEAANIYKEYLISFGKEPPEEIFHEYFYLFLGGKCKNHNLPKLFETKFYDHGNYHETRMYFNNHMPQFEGYEEFKQTISKM